jgi:hypothetical protein
VTTGNRRLGFYDHHRQGYAHLPIDREAEFMIGDYFEEGGCDRGEFKVTLVRLQGRLCPHLEVFGSETDVLMLAIAQGLLGCIGGDVVDRDEFSRRLLDADFRDLSDIPLGAGVS